MERLEVPDRVHVMPVGYENDRLVLPAIELGADRIVLLEPEAGDAREYAESVRERLDDAGIAHETIPCDIFDLYESIGAIAEVASRFEDVSVNIASGSKVTAVAGAIACMATDATPYYVRAERYGEAADSVSEGVEAIYELPTYPIDRPSREHVAVLAHVAEHEPVTKKRLIAYGENEDLPFIADYDGAGEKGKYRLLERHVVDPLAERGYVAVDDVGRTKRVSITDSGRNTLRAFSYLLDGNTYSDN
ncbi:DUF6293 family protein [Halomontanus rarus]|uniref:HFX_2341 family transcriptional regulator domain-containing protein n=1 Tax=Halomontanus rarus TaxID=3034020 RepID=UPI0023E7B33B|nr:DUF6293 family protein [Halovivax sp. TS33]